MAKQTINVGTTANDKKGDSLRAAFTKVNSNFTELYVALGLDSGGLNLGAFEFTGSTISTTDSSSILIDQATVISSNLSVGGDLLPQTANGGDLGSSSLPWRSLYVSNNTIYIGGTPIAIDGSGNLTVNNTQVGGGTDRLSLNGDEVVLVGGANPYVTFPAITGGDQLQISGAEVTALSGNLALTGQSTVTVISNAAGVGGGSNYFTFGADGSLTFPDTTVQTTAALTYTNFGDSGVRTDGGTGNNFWKPTIVDGTGTINKAGVYKTANNSNNSLFTFGANGAGVMSVLMDGSLFVGSTLPSNNGGLNTNFGGWLVVQAGGKFGGDLDTLGRVYLNGNQFEDDSGVLDFFSVVAGNHIVTCHSDWTLKLKARANGANQGNLWLEAGQNTKIKVKGNGSNIDIIASDGSSTATWNFAKTGVMQIPGGVHEKFQAKVDATGVVTHDCSLGNIFYHTSPDADWTVNLTNLNLASGYATAVTLVIVQGGTGYYPSAVQIGGVAQTLNWQGNTTPTPSTNRTDVITFSIINNSGTYTVLGQLTGF